jgi:hypothetical protein
VSKLSINLEEALLRAHRNFEDQIDVFKSSIIIIDYSIIIISRAWCTIVVKALCY